MRCLAAPLRSLLTVGVCAHEQMLCVTNLPPCLFDHTPPGVFDGQGSGHDFYGTLYLPPTGSINNCDGGRAHTYCDYRQE